MDYLRGFKSVLGGQGETTDGPSGAETIERLVNRVSSATLLEDRRDAVRAIKSLSKKFKLEVGTSAMSILISTLERDRTDAEISGLILETLVNIMSNEGGESNAQDEGLALQFTEIFLKESENVTTLLDLLEEYDFRVRWPTTKLLSVLLNNRALQIQQNVLVSPRGVSRLMDLLSDSREVIRNDGLLLLILLTKGNAAIQKIVAFENAFDRLLEIIAEEGFSDGGIVVEDCLLLMTNLFNESNINFFREGSYIQRLVPFFDFVEYTSAGNSWEEQKVKNVLLMLRLVRSLVSPSNPPQSTLSSQKILHSCNLLKILCDILMTVGIPVEVLTETVNAVGEIIRGNQTNQAFFSIVDAPHNPPHNPPKPAIVALLISMVSESQAFHLRCAVLYCFQSYLYKNPNGQSRIISTLLPSSSENVSVTAGHLLCGGLFSPDPFSNWCAAIALSHALIGSKEMKEQLLRVQLATGVSNQPVSLLQQCSNILFHGGSTVQTKAAVLCLLCSWLTNCPVVVAHFLSNGAIIPFLIASVEQPCETHEKVIQGLSAFLIGLCIVYNNNDVESFTVDAIKRVITTRLDPEHFLAKINDVSKTEPFTNAAKHTQISETNMDDVLFDHEFTRQFKKLEVNITKAMIDDDDDESSDRSNETNDAVVMQYKELIREQDEKYRNLSTSHKELEATYQSCLRDLERQAIELVQLRNQVGLMKDLSPSTTQKDYFQTQISSLQETLKQRETEILQLRNETNTKNLSSMLINGDQRPQATTMESGYNSQDGDSPSSALQVELQRQIEELKEENRNLTTNLETTRSNLTITQASLEVITTNKNLEESDAKLSSQQLVELEDLKIRVSTLQRQNEILSQQQQTSATDHELVKKLQTELELKTEKHVQQKQDYEDLLVLLEDQDLQIKRFKSRLRQLGDVIADDSTDEDDDLDGDVGDVGDVVDIN